MNTPRMHRWPRAFLILTAVLLTHAAAATRADSTVVFNEIMFHPAEQEPAMEWVELFNQMSVDMDLSGWSLAAGVHYTFPSGTLIRGRHYLVVAIQPEALQNATRLENVHGPFSGRLSNSGERIELRSHSGRLMDTVRYGTSGDWPVGPDGGGVSLAKLHPDLGSAAAANWRASLEIGGTPGRLNFPPSAPAPAAIQFNELAAAGPLFGLELFHAGSDPIPLEGWVVRRAAAGQAGEFVFPPGQMLAPGEHRWLSAAELGFVPGAGDRLFLHPPGKEGLLDAVVVEPRARARYPDGSAHWFNASSLTPGTSNHVALRDEIVINEIMYHPRPPERADPIPPEVLRLPVDAEWRYHQTGGDLGTAWRQPIYNDGGWPTGRGAFFVEEAALPAPKNTPLTLGRTTYYFRTRFQHSGPGEGLDLLLRPLIDDGAIFYLNGIEVLRLNMPDGPVTAATFASSAVGDATFTGPFAIPTEALVAGTNVLAVQVHQQSAGSTDIVFGLELIERASRPPPEPVEVPDATWIELHNRSAGAVGLQGWRIEGGISYWFPTGTTLPAGGYLVVARDAAHLRSLHPGVAIVGNFERRLSRSSDSIVLRDPDGNVANSVRYFDARPWPEYADGSGSSLELRDPRGDTARPESWAASDEARRSEWRTYTYRGVATANLGPTRWNEFVLGLLVAGEVLMDDISVIESPDGAARELIQNGSFESGAETWRRLGNHRHSRVVTDPDNPGNQVLLLAATGPTEHMHNHLETTLAHGATIVNGREYQISFRAKWLAGSNRLHTRLYFNRLPRTTMLAVPEGGGTPGARNSQFEENAGPALSELQHEPSVPAANQPVTIRVRARDPDGIDQCTLWWAVDGRTWLSQPMVPAGDGSYATVFAGRPASTLVQFYVEAIDRRGARAVFPAGGRESRALFRVRDNQLPSGALQTLRILMPSADAAFLHAATNVMSNERQLATVIANEQEVFYNVGIRLQGSQRGRLDDSRVGYTLRFPPDQLFRGVHNSVSIDRSGGYSGRGGRHDEILLRHLMNHAGGLPEMYNDLVRISAPRSQLNGTGMLILAKYGDVFLDSTFPRGSDGTTFKMELIYYPTTTVGGTREGIKRPQPDEVLGTDLVNLGDDKEAYRWIFLPENNRRQDDYSRLIELAKTFSLSGSALDRATQERMDVDQWMRAFALKSLSGDVDTYGFGYPHNQMLYFRPSDGRALALPWDMDFSWTRPATASLFPAGNIGRIANLPANRRLFFGHLEDLMNRTYNSGYLSRWAVHYGGLVGQNYSGVLSYITQRANSVRSQLPSPLPLRITSNNGEPFLTSDAMVTLNGSGGHQIRLVRLNGEPLALEWRTVNTWRTTLPLVLGRNALTLVAYDYSGRPLSTNELHITSTASTGAPDRDGDGLPDAWELAHGLDPDRADGHEDADGDGRSNLQEYHSGTHPRDPSDVLRLQVQRAADGLEFEFRAAAGRRFRLQARDAADAAWTSVAEFAPDLDDRWIRWAGQIEPRTGTRFYRLVAEPGH